MSDERKRRRWPWVIIALLMLYPLSIGPFLWIVVHLFRLGADRYALPFHNTVFAPLHWLASENPVFKSMLDWWQRLFVPPPV